MIFDFDIPSKLPPGEMKSGLAKQHEFFFLYISKFPTILHSRNF